LTADVLLNPLKSWFVFNWNVLLGNMAADVLMKLSLNTVEYEFFRKFT
jgi:hypothetical protein